MRISFLALPVLMLALMLPACNQAADKPVKPKAAVVDMMRIVRDSEPGKAGMKYLETMQTEMQNKLNEVQTRLEKDPKDEAAMRDLQGIYAVSQQRMQAEQQNVSTQFNDLVLRVINAYREQQGFEMILSLEAALAFDSKIDVTSAVIAEVNKQKIDFKPVAQPEAAPAAVAPAAAPKADAPKADDKAPAAKPAGK